MNTLLSIPPEVILSEIFSRVNYIPPRWIGSPRRSVTALLYGSVRRIITEHDLKKACRAGDFLSVFYCNETISWSMGFPEACYSGNDDLIGLLSSRGGVSREEGFFGACGGGHLDLVRRLTPSDFPLPIRRYGMTLAAENGHEDVVMYLLEGHSELCTAALASAYEGGQQTLIESLRTDELVLEKEVAIGACRGGNEEVARDMIQSVILNMESGEDSTFRTGSAISDFLFSAFYCACGRGRLEIVKFIYRELTKIYPEKKVLSILTMFDSGRSPMNNPLHMAVSGHNIKVVEFLLTNGFQMYESMLIRACELGDLEMASFLIENYGDLIISWTIPFTRSCKSGSLELVVFLRKHIVSLNLFADTKELDFYGLSGASQGGHTSIIDFLLKNDPNLTISAYTLKYTSEGFLSSINYIFNSDALVWNIGKFQSDVLTDSLSRACENNRWETVDWLLNKGAGPCICCHQPSESHLRCADVEC